MKPGRLSALLVLVACGGDSTKAPVTPVVVADPPPSASASAPAPPPAETQATEPLEGGAGGLGDIGVDRMNTPPSSTPPAANVSMRRGVTAVNGKLPPEIVDRVVRQSFGQFRRCYDDKIRPNENLEGRVTVKFVIAQTGAVSTASDGGSDLPDSKVIACVVKAFGALKFPKPDSGIVTVVYPLVFAPPPDPAKK